MTLKQDLQSMCVLFDDAGGLKTLHLYPASSAEGPRK